MAGLSSGRILTLPRSPSPRPSGERAGVRGFEPENLVSPLPGPLLPAGREEEREKKWCMCQDAPLSSLGRPVLAARAKTGDSVQFSSILATGPVADRAAGAALRAYHWQAQLAMSIAP